ncbi:hypothetical protein J4E93_002432 [Alternaria ventricosa]|uniref:uncharacterized protein n=1 Tax=Alternaria ventricosa TaxID=1187951 RepID=UPI0020C40253|nr:uncharacterized protein J4E93_002432 [Alternaria ventricosa]KAI4652233.1 hypothetical protein J4E93_002432 [Alternaria ventricosa]
MAIHADYPGLTVEIYVDGKPLEEYKNPEEEDVPKTTMRYVELAADRTIKTPSRITTVKEKEPFATFQFKYRSIAALKSLGIIPPSPIPSLDPQPDRMLNEEPPATTPQPKTASSTPTPSQQDSSQPILTEHDGLRDSEIIALIKHYRGDTKGLAGQSRKRLLLLLKHYEEEDAESVQIKQEPISNASQTRIKREYADDGAARGQGKKRKPEVIVLDD